MNNKEIMMLFRYIRSICEDTAVCESCPIRNACIKHLKASLWSFTNDAIDEVKNHEDARLAEEKPCIVRL